MLPQAERNAHQTAEGKIHQESQVIAGPDILIAFLIDHIRHILGQN